ncbi:MAG: hypothetical protein ABIH90_02175 [Candidatus Aenigmatarchaeota archaeon]
MVKKEVSKDSYAGIRFDEDIERYKLFDQELEDMQRFRPRPFEAEERPEEKKERVITRASLAGTAFLEKDEIKPLKIATPQIFGSLFDRVEFIRLRIDEIQDTIKIREDMHKSMIDEIDNDIAEKQHIETSLVDMDEKRNFKLDISLLRREKRSESVQFWRDMVELKAELRELTEQLETESKIVGIFKEMKQATDEQAKER